MLSRPFRLTSLASACALLAACDHLGDGGATTGATTQAPSTSASSAAPATSAPPPTDTAPPAAALPTIDPAPVHTAAPVVSASASASVAAGPDAGAPKPAKPVAAAAADAGAGDAGVLASADAGAAPVSEGLRIAREVDAIFADKKTFTARFKQQYTQKAMGTVKDSKGSVSVERPSKISFRYDAPSKNRIVSDGVTIKVYIADDNQMFETPVQKTQYPGALAFMMGNGIATSFEFAINTQAKYAGHVLDGKPLAPNPSYETVMFFVGASSLAKKAPGVIERVLILDAQGNKNRFDFEGAAQPATIDPAEFTFTPPPGTNITR